MYSKRKCTVHSLLQLRTAQIVCVWLRRRFAAQARTERVSRSLKRVPGPAPVIAAAKRARRAVALFSVTYLFVSRTVSTV